MQHSTVSPTSSPNKVRLPQNHSNRLLNLWIQAKISLLMLESIASRKQAKLMKNKNISHINKSLWRCTTFRFQTGSGLECLGKSVNLHSLVQARHLPQDNGCRVQESSRLPNSGKSRISIITGQPTQLRAKDSQHRHLDNEPLIKHQTSFIVQWEASVVTKMESMGKAHLSLKMKCPRHKINSTQCNCRLIEHFTSLNRDSFKWIIKEMRYQFAEVS